MCIQNLPQELLLKICEDLDYASLVALRLLNHSFYSCITTSAYSMADLINIEIWPVYNRAGQSVSEDHERQPCAGLDYFACSYCLRVRSAIHFTNAMMKGKRGKFSPASAVDGRLDRVCIDCCMRYGRITGVGRLIRFGGACWDDSDVNSGEYGIVCAGCRQFKRVRPPWNEDRRRCEQCTSLELCKRGASIQEAADARMGGRVFATAE